MEHEAETENTPFELKGGRELINSQTCANSVDQLLSDDQPWRAWSRWVGGSPSSSSVLVAPSGLCRQWHRRPSPQNFHYLGNSSVKS